MIYTTDFTTTGETLRIPKEYLELLTEQGLEGLPELIRVVVNEAMRIEQEHYLQARPYERNVHRQGHANGYKPKTVKTRVGEVTFEVPQVRVGGFYPNALEKGIRSERALLMTLAEMYVQGVSTRKVASITEQLCGTQVSASQVSRATRTLDEELEAWRNRPLGEIVYLYLDARYEKVRQAGNVRDAAILMATGVKRDGKRAVLGISVSLSEAEAHWRSFLEGLVKRGLEGVQLIISDDHAGMAAARKAIFSGIPWQRCQFHLQQNAQSYVPKVGLRTEVAEDIRTIFDAQDRDTAESHLKDAVKKYARIAPRLADWMEVNLPEGFSVFAFPRFHQKRLRTSNTLERLSQEIKRRTRVVRVFPNEDACLRLVSALLMEFSEDWEFGKIYLNVENT
ncbi:MAG: IS256 family transposase [Anaerolineaceae bacterium]|jgi:transposase-like protein